MEIQIPQEAESTVRDLAVRAGFASVQQYVLNLIHRDSETAAIKVGLQEARAGKFRSFQSFDDEFRALNGIPAGS